MSRSTSVIVIVRTLRCESRDADSAADGTVREAEHGLDDVFGIGFAGGVEVAEPAHHGRPAATPKSLIARSTSWISRSEATPVRMRGTYGE